MGYRNSLQADALELVAKKLQSSLAVEGELPEDGLAAYGNDDDDLMMALARKIVSGEEDEDSVEAVFSAAQCVQAASEEFLVDDGWRAEDTGAEEDGRWAQFGPIGDEQEADQPEVACPQEGRQQLFSWAEFLSKDDGPVNKRRRKPNLPLGTFCVGSSGATLPSNMDNAQRYFNEQEAAARVEHHFSKAPYFWYRDHLRRKVAYSAISRGTPAVVATGPIFNGHYELAYGYAWRARTVKKGIWPFRWTTTEYQRAFLLNPGHGSLDRYWSAARTRYAGLIFPR